MEIWICQQILIQEYNTNINANPSGGSRVSKNSWNIKSGDLEYKAIIGHLPLSIFIKVIEIFISGTGRKKAE
jgi:hypothetical protein